jgi:hypothetical protein
MKISGAVLVIALGGCSAATMKPAPMAGASSCSAACEAHLERCNQAFANFPERGAIECPTEFNRCLKACSGPPAVPRGLASLQGFATPVAAPDNKVNSVSSKEAKLRELKHLYDEGLLSEDVYRARQTVILAEP